MQELVQKMTDKCFSKCTGKSGTRLDGKVRTHSPHLFATLWVRVGIKKCRVADAVHEQERHPARWQDQDWRTRLSVWDQWDRIGV